jgi:CRP-like cAMP-binding protein
MNTPMHARDVDQHPRSTMTLAPLDALAMTIRCKIGAPIYTCGEPARFWYRIATGAARQCVFSRRGYRHIVDFLRPGDLFGFDARDTYQFSVEPIAAGTTVARYPRTQAERLVDCDPLVARRIRELAFDSALRAKRRSALIGRATAVERVSTFLLETVDRHPGGACGVVLLPSRYDIADKSAARPAVIRDEAPRFPTYPSPRVRARAPCDCRSARCESRQSGSRRARASM